MIQFSNPETAKKFEPLTEIDQHVHVPKVPGEQCYRGNLSDITPEAATRYVRWGGNLIKSKEPVTSSAVATIAALVEEDAKTIKAKR
jgi:hypothetical protein